MNRLQQIFVARAVLDGDWRTDRYDQRRVMSVEELDEIADVAWHWGGLKRVLAACASAVQAIWRSRASTGRADTPVVSAEA